MKRWMYWRMVISFLLIICFSIASGVFIYLYTYRMFESEISNSNANSLKQLSLQFDAQVKNANTFFYRTDLDSDIKRLILQDSKQPIDTASIYKAHTILETMRSADASDFIIYLISSNRVISSVNSALEMEKYHRVYYKSPNFDLAAFKGCFSGTNISSVKSFGGIYDIAIFHSLPSHNLKDPNAVAMYKPHKTAVMEMLNSARYSGEAIIAIKNRDGDLITYTYGDYDHSILDQINISSDYYKRNIDGKEYIYQTVYSDYSDCSFISIVPTSIFWSKLYTIRTYSIIITTIYILLGLIITFLLSRHNYAPISSLVKDIDEWGKIIPSTGFYNPRSEIDYIRNIIDTTLSQQEQYSKVRQDEFLLQALQGVYPESEDIFNEFGDAGIQLISDKFLVALFHVDSWDPNKVPKEHQYNQALILEPIIYNKLNPLCNINHKVFVTYNALDTYIAILNLAKDEPADISQILHKLQSELEEEMHIICTVAYSSEHYGWNGLETAFGEAESALKYRTIFGTGSILSYQDLEEEARFRYNFDFHGSAKHLICLSIIEGKPSSRDAIEQIKQDSCKNGIHSLEEFRCYFYDMNNLLHKVTDRLGLGKDLIGRLAYCETLQQLDETLVEILDKLHNLYITQVARAEDFKREQELCNQIIAFIEEYYSDPNISVGSISEHFNLTSSYLSSRFKEFTGLTIFEHLTNTRVEEAKELLISTSMTLDQIAANVGLNSSATLIRIFKKAENVTPGAYRQVYKRTLINE